MVTRPIFYFLKTILSTIFNQKPLIIINSARMNQETVQKEIVHWNILTFQHLNSITDLIHNNQKNDPPSKYHYRLRDFFFSPSFELFDFKNQPTFIEQSGELIKNFVALNQEAYLQSIAFERQIQKHRFWNKVYKLYVKKKEDHQAKEAVRNIVWTYRLIPVTFFLFAAVTIFRLSGVYQMSMKKQVVGLVTAAIMGDLFVRTKKSSQIFYLIPPLASPSLQQQRLNIVNKSIVLDGKINQIELHPRYVDQLIDEAQKEESIEQKKLILEAAGYTIVDRVDFEY